jgi:hypothetical protein
MKPTRRMRNFALPLAILAPLLWLMIGCLYIPTGEYTEKNGLKQDFRPLIGGDHKSIIAGAITRQRVQSLLGMPQAASTNNEVVVYFITTGKNIWIQPLCFEGLWADHKLHVLELRFDDRDLLTNVYSFSEDCTKKAKFIEFIDMTQEGYVDMAMRHAIETINDRNDAHYDPVLIATGEMRFRKNPEPPPPLYIDPYTQPLPC